MQWGSPCKSRPAEASPEQPSSIRPVSCSACCELRKSAERDWGDLNYSLKQEARHMKVFCEMSDP